MEHSILIREDHCRKYAELGFHMTTSVGFAWGKGDLYGKRMGRHVWPDLIPLERMISLGLNVACGTDWGPLSLIAGAPLAKPPASLTAANGHAIGPVVSGETKFPAPGTGAVFP